MGVGHALRLEEDEPRGAATRVPRAARGARSSRRVLHFALGRRARLPGGRLERRDLPGRARRGLRAFNAFTPVLGSRSARSTPRSSCRSSCCSSGRGARSGAEQGDARASSGGSAGCPGFVYTLFTLPPRRAAATAATSSTSASSSCSSASRASRGTSTARRRSPRRRATRSSDYTLEYVGARMEVDNNKRMIFADVDVLQARRSTQGRLSPAKFIYKKQPDSPTTEVAHRCTGSATTSTSSSGSINPQTKVAAFQIHVNPLVSVDLVRVHRPHRRAASSACGRSSSSASRASGRARAASRRRPRACCSASCSRRTPARARSAGA